MVWYRHWLEMRSRALGAVVFILVMTYSFSPFHSPNVGFMTRSFEHQYGHAGARAWGAHAEETAALVMVMTLMAMGSGITAYAGGGNVSSGASYFTLGLPISRRRLYLTRLLAAGVEICAGFALALALNCAVLLWKGETIPWLAMAATSVVGVVATLPAMNVAHLAIMTLGFTAGIALSMAAVAAVLGLMSLAGGILPLGIPWFSIGAAFAVTAALSGVTLRLIERREF